jgi:hypothetical protein
MLFDDAESYQLASQVLSALVREAAWNGLYFKLILQGRHKKPEAEHSTCGRMTVHMSFGEITN